MSIIPERKRYWMGVGGIFAILASAVLFYLSSAETPSQGSMPHSHEHEGHGAEAGNWAVDYDKSKLGFVGSENGKEFNGGFANFKADIEFNPEDPADAEIQVIVTTASAFTGDSLQDSNLPGSEWFDVKNYPQATFGTSDVRALGGNQYAADGTLIIKDIERPVALRFTLDIENETAHAIGYVDLIRTDFGLGANASWLDDEGLALEVRVEFEIHATQKG